MKRNKIYYLILIVSTIILGLATRHYSNYLPSIINLGLGDLLWALMVYWIIGFLFPRYSIQKLALISLSICFLIEFSQLCQVDWLNAMRSNRFGSLVLGKGFLWTDLLAYTIGIGIGMTSELYLEKNYLSQE
ncbi:ribosomal maturation YjgA family protein [Aureispira anguillae]|uniref:DUF2809 domain-containing protein n=1 Tax=Aureispira anguillae TaxID=2864201 RepID=A0A915YFI3_9BACT|nr:DUF2809 domain-containing protein [Aureispira anguillae]BDS12048.1 DUF2809 domain-containing protein [Aureispira anguillae]